ncbi:MAG: hypothetical protein ACLFU8_16295 [Anaerolineales bacterium]
MTEPYGSEYVKVEKPFIEQPQALGWDHLPGDVAVPYLTARRHCITPDTLVTPIGCNNLPSMAK